MPEAKFYPMRLPALHAPHCNGGKNERSPRAWRENDDVQLVTPSSLDQAQPFRKD
jgi:hypothetical protein